MNNQQRLNLDKLIQKSDSYVDNTKKIRGLKHSVLIKQGVDAMVKFKDSYEGVKNEAFKDLCCQECSFLFFNYTNIFNKIYNDEIDLSILDDFLSSLKEIEDGGTDQNEASVKVGTLLKKLYIDSVIKRADKTEGDKTEMNETSKPEPKTISWTDYKIINQK